jgi:hypothetical protein
MTSRYEPLRECLAAHTVDELVSLTWDDLEGLVGPLPPSALTRQWWAKTTASHQAQNLLGFSRRRDAVDRSGFRPYD